MLRSILILFSLFFCLFCFSCKERTIHWEPVSKGHSEDLHNGYFINDQSGWIISYGTGRLLHTGNGGVSWQLIAQLDSIYYEDIVFTSPDKGWLCGEYGSLLQTDNGGRSWSKTTVADSSIAFYGIDFISPLVGVLAGFDVKIRRPVILITNNGGESWEHYHPTLPLSGGLEHICFVDDHNWFIGGMGYILHTKDGGTSWQAAILNEYAIIRGLFFFNKNSGWAVGHDGMVFHTCDGGWSWQQDEKFTENRLRNVYFINSKTGYICGDNNKEQGSLWCTKDGGKSWHLIFDTIPDIHRIIESDNYLWLIGKSGTMVKIKI